MHLWVGSGACGLSAAVVVMVCPIDCVQAPRILGDHFMQDGTTGHSVKPRRQDPSFLQATTEVPTFGSTSRAKEEAVTSAAEIGPLSGRTKHLRVIHDWPIFTLRAFFDSSARP